jgi:hypothetical protein
MNARLSLLLVVAKMALLNNEISRAEREFLEPLLPPAVSLEQLFAEAQSRELPELLQNVHSYPDKFLVAWRAARMAYADGLLQASEEAFYDRLLTDLEITAADREVIERSVAALEDDEMGESDERIQELRRQSSLA